MTPQTSDPKPTPNLEALASSERVFSTPTEIGPADNLSPENQNTAPDEIPPLNLSNDPPQDDDDGPLSEDDAVAQSRRAFIAKLQTLGPTQVANTIERITGGVLARNQLIEVAERNKFNVNAWTRLIGQINADQAAAAEMLDLVFARQEEVGASVESIEGFDLLLASGFQAMRDHLKAVLNLIDVGGLFAEDFKVVRQAVEALGRAEAQTAALSERQVTALELAAENARLDARAKVFEGLVRRVADAADSEIGMLHLATLRREAADTLRDIDQMAIPKPERRVDVAIVADRDRLRDALDYIIRREDQVEAWIHDRGPEPPANLDHLVAARETLKRSKALDAAFEPDEGDAVALARRVSRLEEAVVDVLDVWADHLPQEGRPTPSPLVLATGGRFAEAMKSLRLCLPPAPVVSATLVDDGASS